MGVVAKSSHCAAWRRDTSVCAQDGILRRSDIYTFRDTRHKYIDQSREMLNPTGDVMLKNPFRTLNCNHFIDWRFTLSPYVAKIVRRDFSNLLSTPWPHAVPISDTLWGNYELSLTQLNENIISISGTYACNIAYPQASKVGIQ